MVTLRYLNNVNTTYHKPGRNTPSPSHSSGRGVVKGGCILSKSISTFIKQTSQILNAMKYLLPLADHPCSRNNGYCTHLCLITPSGYQCACPDVDDGRSCSTTPAPPPTTPSTTTEPTKTPPPTLFDYCQLQPCENGASCEFQMTDNDYTCHCVGYYKGKNCSEELSELCLRLFNNSCIRSYMYTIFHTILFVHDLAYDLVCARSCKRSCIQLVCTRSCV